MNVQNIRSTFQEALFNEDFVIDKTGVKLLEIVGASFIADEDAIFGKVNYDYVEREIEWYNSQDLNVNAIPGNIPKIWQDISDRDGYINSNYGWCIFSKENHDQYQNVLNELNNNPRSRRATMIYTRPTMWNDYDRNGMSDFMCTNAVQYVVRDNKLDCIVQMRSNDVVYGYKNDRAWQKYVLENLAKELRVEVGNIHWQVGSLHVYEAHFDMVDENYHA